MKDDRKQVVGRLALLIAASLLVLAAYLLRLVYLQLVQGEHYLSLASTTTSYDFKITAARGDIVDRYGRRIATNKTCYNLVLSKLLLGDADLNTTLQDLVRILQANDEAWNDTLLISAPDETGGYRFTADADSDRDQASLAAVKTALKLQQYATADDVMAAIVEKYALQDYAPEWQRILGGIRYQMTAEGFSTINNFTLATDVSDVTVATVREHSLTIAGAEIEETATRTYPDGTILPHIIGSVGKIMAEQWKVTDENGRESWPLRELGYNMNDIVGQSGLESVLELELRGQSGVRTVTVDSDGMVTGSEITTEPQPGATAMLTVDKDFQRAVDQALERRILTLQQTGGTGSGAEACAGAVVVIDVKTGGILALSNYPGYDLNLYNSNYSEYAADPALPLYNRALMGLYTPGSTFKPAVATAALLSGTITTSETVRCTGKYTFYSDYTPRCAQHGHGNGSIGLVDAIKWSCNIFFYDVGRRTTSAVYDEYARRLGLGVQTGVETEAVVGRGLTEYTGHLTSTEDSNYTVSLEIQAAIGQGNTVVTPVGLATYAATLASHGTRYRTHLIQALLDTNTGEVIQEFEPVVEDYLEDNVGAFDAIERGMIGVAQTTNGLSGYPYTIACKTGSPQRAESYINSAGTRKYYTNTMMIAYGPVEDPQIAIGIVIEYGGGGSYAGPLAADIFNAYFFEQSGTLTSTQENTLLE